MLQEEGARDAKATVETLRTMLLDEQRDAATELLRECTNAADEKFLATLVLAAAGLGYQGVLSLLRDSGAIMHPKDATFLTPLVEAARNGHTEVVRFLLRCGAPNEIETAVAAVASKGHDSALRLLLDAGASVKDTYVPLAAAMNSGSLGTVQLLLNAGATAQNASAVLRAASKGHQHLVRELLRAGANLDVGDKSTKGNPPLHLAVNMDKTTFHCLLDLGANIEAPGADGWTALHTAADWGYPYVVQVLLDRGANVDARDDGQRTPLFLAVRRRRAEVVRLLVEAGADTEARDEDEQTPLFVAFLANRREIMQYLLDRGVNAHVRDDIGRTMLHCAAAGTIVETARFLLHDVGLPLEGLDCLQATPLFSAVTSVFDNDEMIQFLLSSGANVGARDTVGRTPLHALVRVRRSNRDRCRRTIALLRSYGLDIDATDRGGCTALHVAVEDGHAPLVVALLKAGASMHLQTVDGSTPLHVAAKYGRKQLLRLFHAVCAANAANGY